MSSLPLAPALKITDFLGTSETVLTVAKWRMNILDVALLVVLEPFHSWNTQDLLRGFPGGSDGKASVCNAGDLGSISGLGRSSGEGNAAHSSTFAWKIPWTEEPSRLQSMGWQRVRRNWATSLPGGSVGKESTYNAGDTGNINLIPSWGRSPGGGHGNPLQYCCLEKPKDRGAWWAMVYRVAKSWTWLKHLSVHTCRNFWR